MKILIHQVKPYRHVNGEVNYTVDIVLDGGGIFCNGNGGFEHRYEADLWVNGAQAMAALLGVSTTVEFQDIRT